MVCQARAATAEPARGAVKLPPSGWAPGPERARPGCVGHWGWDSQVAFPADDTQLHRLVT